MKKNKPECNDPYCHTYGRCVRDHKKESSSPVELSIAEKDMCKRFHADAGLLMAWIGNQDRDPSWVAFPAGPGRRVAEEIERACRIHSDRSPQLIALMIMSIISFVFGALLTLGACMILMKSPDPKLVSIIDQAKVAVLNDDYVKAREVLGVVRDDTGN